MGLPGSRDVKKTYMLMIAYMLMILRYTKKATNLQLLLTIL